MKKILAAAGLRQGSLEDSDGNRIPGSARWLGEQRTPEEQELSKRQYNIQQRQALEEEEARRLRATIENQTSVQDFGSGEGKTPFERLPSFIFGEPISWNTGETHPAIEKKIYNLYEKKITEMLLASRKNYIPIPKDYLEELKFQERNQNTEQVKLYKIAIINTSDSDEEQFFTRHIKVSYPFSLRSNTQYRLNPGEIAGIREDASMLVETSILSMEEDLRKKLINLYKEISLGEFDVKSDEFKEIENLIMRLAGSDWVWQRQLPYTVVRIDDRSWDIADAAAAVKDGYLPKYYFEILDGPVPQTWGKSQDGKHMLHLSNGIKLNDGTVLFFKLPNWVLGTRSNIISLIMEKKNFVDSLNRNDVVEHKSGKSTAAPITGIAAFLDPKDVNNMAVASKNTNKQTRKQRDHAFKKKKSTKSKKGGTRKYKLKSKKKRARKRSCKRKTRKK